MIISEQLKFLFIHNPKVAGSSIRKVLLPYNSSPFELWHQRYVQSLERVVDLSHLAAKDLSSLLTVPKGYFRFGFVREPYERFLSAVHEHSKQNNLDLSSSKENLSQWVLNKLTPTSVRYDWNLSHFCPQHYYFYSGNTCEADFIGTQADLNSDWIKVLSILDLDPELHSLGNERQRFANPPKVSILEHLTIPALQRINLLYAKDWFWFGNRFSSILTGGLPSHSHEDRVYAIRTPEGRSTFYGEPPNLSLGEKVGYLTTRVETLTNSLKIASYEDPCR